ncbi:hypothetical protein [Cyanobium sp. Aljojuca 7D2]|uniref:esterase/lipase family protein n=1 Tax=Cyanobium sp. Aljojuca 7D2 TaxID=2823698 RepID=UPI0028F40A6A|nr:hypothetical protein [Cyanobium sp. Aljojuca 7D2]
MLDSPRVFDGLKRALGDGRHPLLIPDLPLRLGLTPVPEAAELLGSHIEAAFGLEQPVDVLGFSIGGVIARTWIQLLGGTSAPGASPAWAARSRAPSQPNPGRDACWRALPI